MVNRAQALQSRLESSVEQMTQELLKIKPDVVIHLAGMILTDDCEKNPDRCFELNVEGSKKWLLACQKAQVKKFIFASSSHVYADSTQDLDTDSALGPINTYGKSKLMAENELQKISLNENCLLKIARIFSVTDKSMKPGFLYSNLISRALKKDYSPIPGLNCVRDFITADEVAQKLFSLANSNTDKQIINICSGKPTLIYDLAKSVYSQYGADPTKITEGPRNPRHRTVGIPTDF
jgi:nucleoside-diphosphate-sugar epimerase